MPHEPGLHECDECGQVFDTPEELMEHKRMVHGKDRTEMDQE